MILCTVCLPGTHTGRIGLTSSISLVSLVELVTSIILFTLVSSIHLFSSVSLAYFVSLVSSVDLVAHTDRYELQLSLSPVYLVLKKSGAFFLCQILGSWDNWSLD